MHEVHKPFVPMLGHQNVEQVLAIALRKRDGFFLLGSPGVSKQSTEIHKRHH